MVAAPKLNASQACPMSRISRASPRLPRERWRAGDAAGRLLRVKVATLVTKAAPTSLTQLHLDVELAWPDYPANPRLLLHPLQPAQLLQTAELLTSSFIEAKHYHDYRKLLRRRITKYLEEHIALIPQTVVITALLQLPSQPELAPSCTQSPNHSTRESNRGGISSSSSSSSSSNPSPGNEVDVSTNLLAINDYACEGSAQLSGTAHSPPPGKMDSHISACSAAGQHHEAATQPPQQVMGGLTQTQCQAQTQTQKGTQTPLQFVVGTAEVSFDRSTHSANPNPWLNPPRSAAYLCNMAVAAPWQRRGVGQALMQAVEQACHLAGQRELYLHLRVQDKPAETLYLKCGFREVARDSWLVQYLGWDQLRLMRKRLG